mmetsp:Transcript_6511/g.10026  ORF Transcript_6511/g.10026 Transcript_6511/m.10026 type:complete len:426 (+) Transcript_6511:42-1319(+)
MGGCQVSCSTSFICCSGGQPCCSCTLPICWENCCVPCFPCICKEEEFDEQAVKVDIQLAEEQIKNMYTFKLLLLGAGESGKSTILKQIKLINRWKPSEDDLEAIARGLKNNIVECMQNLAERSTDFKYNIEGKENDLRLRLLASKLEDEDVGEFFTVQRAKEFKMLLETDAFKKTLARRDEFWLLESFDYLAENMIRIAAEDFVPSEEDMVMARVRTTGIVKTQFDHKVAEKPNVVTYEVVDVGGQRSERKKWLHCFDNVSAVLFVSNLAGYSKKLFEDQKMNRMKESLTLFEEIMDKQVFQNIPVYLIFNKKDLFERQIQKGDITTYFEDYKGETKDMRSVLNFFKEKFEKSSQDKKVAGIFDISAKVKVDVKGLFEQIKKELYDAEKEKLKKEAFSLINQLNRNKALLAKHGKDEQTELKVMK